jgi:hypothetical protein
VQRLLAAALGNWYFFDGYAVAHGLGELGELELDRFVNLIRYLSTRNMNEDQLRTYELKLFRPPRRNGPAVGPWSPAAETAALADLRGAF